VPTEDAHIGTSLPKFSPTNPLLEELLEELEKPPVETKPLELVDELLLENAPEDELLDDPLLEEELLKPEPPEELIGALSSYLHPPTEIAKSRHAIMDRALSIDDILNPLLGVIVFIRRVNVIIKDPYYLSARRIIWFSTPHTISLSTQRYSNVQLVK